MQSKLLLIPLIFSVLLLGFSFNQDAHAASVCVDSPTGLVGFWNLDETIGTVSNDSVGANHGNYVGTPSPVTGFVNGALDFDGCDYVRISSNSLLEPAQLTIDAWVKANGSPVGLSSIL